MTMKHGSIRTQGFRLQKQSLGKFTRNVPIGRHYPANGAMSWPIRRSSIWGSTYPDIKKRGYERSEDRAPIDKALSLQSRTRSSTVTVEEASITSIKRILFPYPGKERTLRPWLILLLIESMIYKMANKHNNYLYLSLILDNLKTATALDYI